jgi:hypothetical protein
MSKAGGIRLRFLRRWVQALSAVAHNAWLPGFATGTIWKGKTKFACVPGFNCYSCPGALGSCPVGALQAVIGSRKFNILWAGGGMDLPCGRSHAHFREHRAILKRMDNGQQKLYKHTKMIF